jgi:hypothetical protein
VPSEPAQSEAKGRGAAFFAIPIAIRTDATAFINETEFKGIDVGVDYKSVLSQATVSREAFVMP